MSSPAGIKVCAGPCGESLPLANFNRDRKAKDKRGSWCKRCTVKLQRKRASENRARLSEYKKKRGGCAACPEGSEFKYNPKCLELHHKDPSQKKFGIGKNMGTSWKRIREEADKCAVLCANHHRIYHSSSDEEKESFHKLWD